jgi:hypothetical protein
MAVQPVNFPRGAVVDPKTGQFTPLAQRFFLDLYRKLGSATNNAPINSLNITQLLNLASQVTSQLASANIVGNAQLNTTNFCTVDSIDNGVNTTIRVYGSGGVGSTWTRKVGTVISGPFPALSQAGSAYSSDVYVMFNPVGSVFVVTTLFADTTPDGYFWCGKTHTVAAGGAGGTSGGGGNTGGNGGACFSGNTLVKTPSGPMPFDKLPLFPTLLTRHGALPAKLIVSEYSGPIHSMGDSLVTPKHPFARDGKWIAAEELFPGKLEFTGTVYNAHILTDDEDERNYELANGNLVHNLSMF